MEATDFFSRVSAMQIAGSLIMTIKQESENLTVSLLLKNEQCADNAQKLIPPLILKGTAEELDNGFFESVQAPIAETSALLVNMENYLKGQKEAKAKSAMEKEKADKQKKEKEAKEKKYADALQKATELEKEGKFKEAWMKVPDPNEYPEDADTLRKRREELSRQFAPDLFAADSQ